MPLTIAPSSWNYSQGASWISYLNTDEKKDAIDIAASHNTDKTGTAQDFADQVRTTLGADTEIWETEQHGWKGNSSTSEAMSFSYMIETIRAGFTGLSGWLAIGTTSQGHAYLLNNGSTVKRNVKYYMFKKLSNTSNYGYALDIDQTDDLSSTMALIQDNLLTIWVINTSSSAVLTEFDISGFDWDGSEVKWTRWDEDLSINADETPEGIEGVALEASASSVKVVLNGRAAYCIEIPLVDYEDNFPFVQAENYTALSGAVDQGSYVAYSAGGSESSYNLDIVKTYPHDVAFRVSSASANIAFDVYDGTNLLTSVSRIATGGAGNWTTIYRTLLLDGGPMELRVVAQNGGWNLDWIKFDQQYYSATESTLDNLALGLSTNDYSAGSVHSAGYEADKAFDGDTGTRWASAVATPWLEVDFGTSTTVNGSWILDYGDRTKGYEIQYYDGSWKTAFIGGDPDDAGQTDIFPAVTGTKFRLQVTSSSGNPSIWEFQLYYIPTPDVASMTLDGSALTLEWSGIEGETYALQSTTNLTDGFTTIESGIPVHESVNMNTVATPDDAAFYRIILED
ncbi:discoidin domain-containing protein, partial [Pontiella sp.]|uniref:discoidin domain-containing protein n=1 Tax=Pontiella sp. TaxID=2837462 RepID=UPI00356458D9